MVRTFLRRVRESTIAGNVLALYGAHLVGLLVPLVTVPYLARVLRPAGWGLVVFAQSFGAWLALVLEWAFDLWGTREVARVRDDAAAVERIVSSVQGAKLLVLAFVSLAAGAAWALVPTLRDNPLYLWWAWAFAVARGFTPFWYFLGVERMRIPANVEVAGRAAAALAVFVAVQRPSDGWRVLALQAVATAATTLVLTRRLYRDVPPRRPRLRDALGALREAWSVFVLRASSGAYIQANAFVLGLLTNPIVVGYFGGAERIVRAAINLLHPLTQALFPRLSHLATSDREAGVRLLRVGLMGMVTIGGVMGLVAAVGAEWLVRLFLGPGYEAAVPVLRILAALPPVIAVGTVLGIHWALPMRLDRPFAALVFAAGLANIALAVLLAPRFGATGMAIAVLMADLMVTGGLVVLFARHARPSPGGAA